MSPPSPSEELEQLRTEVLRLRAELEELRRQQERDQAQIKRLRLSRHAIRAWARKAAKTGGR